MRLSQNIRRSVFTGPFSINQTIQKASKVFLCCLPVVAGYYVVCTKCRPCGYLWRNFLMFYYHEFIVIITVDFYFVADFGLQWWIWIFMEYIWILLILGFDSTNKFLLKDLPLVCWPMLVLLQSIPKLFLLNGTLSEKHYHHSG